MRKSVNTKKKHEYARRPWMGEKVGRGVFVVAIGMVWLWCQIVTVSANVSTGDSFACAVLEEGCGQFGCFGHNRCWGRNNRAQLNVTPDGA
jgi:hypothetical protein